MVELGSGDYVYETTGEDGGNLQPDATYKEATAVAVDSDDNVFVFNRGTHPMIVFSPEGDILDTWGHGEFSNPHGVTIGPDGSIWTVDNGDHTVKKFTAKGEKLAEIQAEHPAKEMSGDPFCRPAHLAVCPKTGNLFVADGYSNARVHKYDPNGRLIMSWGESGTGPGQFNIVHNLIIHDGLVYVADRENQRVQVFDTEGKFISQWNDMSRVAAICMDPAEDDPLIYLGEYFCGIGSNAMGTNLGPRVSVMSRTGDVLARVGTESYGDEPGRFYSPHGIAVDSKGDIYVAEVAWSDYGSQMDPPRELRSMQKLVKQ
ncbi:peptidyl-alpha-hydroxyglycine alpha-amidating lyase family protein [bacterium]|nr:peptidyl-alpha-hydroxyglycine alpha-amidating lyase family protein [bacterium]